MSQFKTGGEIIKAICYSNDTQLVNVKQASAAVKSKSAKSINAMATDVIEQLQYSDSVKSILKDIEFEERQSQYVPVIFSETDSMMTEDSVIKNIYSSSEAKYSNDSKYLNQLKDASENLDWNEVSDKDFESIKNSYQAKISSEISNERVAKEMLRLFNETKWAETGGNK